jgi:hypothetical protein
MGTFRRRRAGFEAMMSALAEELMEVLRIEWGAV